MSDVDGAALIERLCAKYGLEYLPQNIEGSSTRLCVNVAYVGLRKLEALAKAQVQAGADPDLEFEYNMLESVFTGYLELGLEARGDGIDERRRAFHARLRRKIECPYTAEAYDAAMAAVRLPDGTFKLEALAAAIVKKNGKPRVSRDTLRKYGRPE